MRKNRSSLKKREEDIKEEIIKNFEDEFVEHYSSWKKHLKDVNKILDLYNDETKSGLSHLNYDEFCINMLASFRDMLDEFFNIEDIIPDKDEKEQIRRYMKNKNDEVEFEKKIVNLKEAKYSGVKKNLNYIWQKNSFILLMKKSFDNINVSKIAKIKNEYLNSKT